MISKADRTLKQRDMYGDSEKKLQGEENGQQYLKVALDAFPFFRPPRLTSQQALAVFSDLFL